MTLAFLNPGAGYVEHATPLRALRNILHFCEELGLERVMWRRLSPNDDEGRWRFRLTRGRRHVVVDMPGCPLKVVRDLWLAKTFESLAAPRLYVDSSSYNWNVALESARDRLKGV